MPSPDPAYGLEIRGLVKRFDRPAVDGLGPALAVGAADSCARRGPTGPGTPPPLGWGGGRPAPAAGTLTIAGIDARADPVAAKRVRAWVSDEPMIYDKLTPFEYLEFVAGL